MGVKAIVVMDLNENPARDANKGRSPDPIGITGLSCACVSRAVFQREPSLAVQFSGLRMLLSLILLFQGVLRGAVMNLSCCKAKVI